MLGFVVKTFVLTGGFAYDVSYKNAGGSVRTGPENLAGEGMSETPRLVFGDRHKVLDVPHLQP